MSGIVGQNLGRGSGLVKVTAVDADSVTGASIADDAIDSEHYTDGSIDNAHIADDAINSEHYADGSIDNAHIADDAIDSEHYAAASIDNAHLADNAVDTAEIADNAITLAKMAGGTDGNLISFDTSGNPVAVATGSDGQILTSSGSGAVCAFEDAAAAGGITEQDSWRITSTYTASGENTITANWERSDACGYSKLGTGLTESSGIFTFPSTGHWMINIGTYVTHTSDDRYGHIDIRTTNDDSTYCTLASTGFNTWGEASTRHSGATLTANWDVTDVTNDKFKFDIGSGLAVTWQGNTTSNLTYVTVIRLADT